MRNVIGWWHGEGKLVGAKTCRYSDISVVYNVSTDDKTLTIQFKSL